MDDNSSSDESRSTDLDRPEKVLAEISTMLKDPNLSPEQRCVVKLTEAFATQAIDVKDLRQRLYKLETRIYYLEQKEKAAPTTPKG